MADPEFFLETPRLYISQYLPDLDRHCQFLVKLFNSPAFLRNAVDRKVRTTEEARTHIQTVIIKEYLEHGFGAFILSLKSSSSISISGSPNRHDLELIGSVGLFQRKSLKFPDIGYSILQEYEGKGYATEAGKAILEYALGPLRKKEVFGLTGEGNEASKRILTKIGLVHWGNLKLAEWDTPSVVYVLPGVTEVTVIPHTNDEPLPQPISFSGGLQSEAK